ncbi:hypothetical protein C8R42DRAFT_187629 [Lentinula raphanica]|nr:hypothetical protein C8R42DRAFT_187629 [Lentinula raphanica]
MLARPPLLVLSLSVRSETPNVLRNRKSTRSTHTYQATRHSLLNGHLDDSKIETHMEDTLSFDFVIQDSGVSCFVPCIQSLPQSCYLKANILSVFMLRVCARFMGLKMVDNTSKASICHLQPLSGTCMHYVPSMLLNDIVNMLAWKCAWPCRKLTTNSSCLWARSRLRFYRKWLYPFPSNA